MRRELAYIGMALLPTIGAVFFSAYVLRWLSVLLLSVLTILYLFGYEISVAYPQREKEMNRPPIKDEFERTLKLVKKAEKSAVSRELIEESIIEIYSTLSNAPSDTYYALKKEPNRALKVLRDEGSFLDNLERALKILEHDLMEGEAYES